MHIYEGRLPDVFSAAFAKCQQQQQGRKGLQLLSCLETLLLKFANKLSRETDGQGKGHFSDLSQSWSINFQFCKFKFNVTKTQIMCHVFISTADADAVTPSSYKLRSIRYVVPRTVICHVCVKQLHIICTPPLPLPPPHMKKLIYCAVHCN